MPVEDLASYVGPTPYCNWVIKGKVMAGGYPACVDDEENDELLLLLMRDYGFDTFVCLQSEVSSHVTERAWRSGRAPRPYMHDIRRLMAAHKRHIPNPKVDFVHLPIVDGSVTSDAVLDRFVDDLIRRVRAGKRLYIHCWGGHGRTGTVVAIMLGRMYDVTTSQALERTQLLHDLRDEPQDVGSPSTEVQVAQVRRLLSARYGGPGDGDPGRGNLHRGDRAGYGGGRPRSSRFRRRGRGRGSTRESFPRLEVSRVEPGVPGVPAVSAVFAVSAVSAAVSRRDRCGDDA